VRVLIYFLDRNVLKYNTSYKMVHVFQSPNYIHISVRKIEYFSGGHYKIYNEIERRRKETMFYTISFRS